MKEKYISFYKTITNVKMSCTEWMLPDAQPLTERSVCSF